MTRDEHPPRTGTVYRGLVVDVEIERVHLPGGAEAELERVHHPGGAAVVAVDRVQRVCLLWQYRYAAGGWLWELPAGKRDHDEEPARTARRELAEEAGITADTWDGLGSAISSPGVFTEVVHLFLAHDLHKVAHSPEPHEVFEVHWVPFAEALEWAAVGRIRDAKSVIGLFRAAVRLGALTGR